MATAILLWASYHPLNLGLLGWIALVPLLCFSLEVKGWRAFLASWLGGWLFWALALLWIRHTAAIGPWVIALYKGLYFPLFGMIVRRLRLPVAATAPVAWIALEFARSHLMGGLPYNLLAYTQHEMLVFIQCADLLGPWLVSGIVVLVNAVVARAILVRREEKVLMRDREFRVSCGATGLLLVACAVYGAVRLNIPLVDGPRIAVIQPNIPQELKLVMGRDRDEKDRIYAKHVSMTLKLVGDGEKRDLIIWPESVLYEGLGYHSGEQKWMTWDYPWDEWYARIVVPSKAAKTRILLGLEVVDCPDGTWRNASYTNSALYIDPDREIIGRYDKVHLVPFSERVPGPDVMRKLVEKYTGLERTVDFRAGTEHRLFEAGGRKFGVAICFEVVYPEISREIAGKGGQILVNISNEGWFRDSAELDQMLALSRFRAIESRMAVVRGTNTGISAFIEPTGRYAAVVKGKEVEGVLDARVRVTEGGSLYRSVGDLLAWLSIAAVLAGLGWRGVRYFVDRKKPGTYS